jgi:hypothetical protein
MYDICLRDPESSVISNRRYCILLRCTLLNIENDAEISPVRYTWKVAEKGFKMTFMINKLAIINSCEIILEKSK